MSYGHEFKAAVENRKPETFLTGMFSTAQGQQAPPPQQTLLSSVGFLANPGGTAALNNTSTAKPGANQTAAMTQKTAACTAEQAQDQMAQIETIMNDMVSEACAVADGIGVNMAQACPEANSGDSGTMVMHVAAAGGATALSGLGTVVTHAIESCSIAPELIAEAKVGKISPKELCAKIDDAVRSATPSATAPSGMGAEKANTASVTPLQNVVAAGYSVQDVVDCARNLNNLPEYQAAATVRDAALNIGDNEAVVREETAYKAGLDIGTEQMFDGLINDGEDAKLAGDYTLATGETIASIKAIWRDNAVPPLSNVAEQIREKTEPPKLEVPPPQVAQADVDTAMKTTV